MTIINLEREFFKIAKYLDNYSNTKNQFISKINKISEEWIDNKFRLGVLGLKN